VGIRASEAEGRKESANVDVRECSALGCKVLVVFTLILFWSYDFLTELLLRIRLLAVHEKPFALVVRIKVGYLLHKPVCVLCVIVDSSEERAFVVLAFYSAAIRTSE